jgi:uncharacterized ubiquitin-like protein YukD
MKITIDVRDYAEARFLTRLAKTPAAIADLRDLIDRLIADDAALRRVIDRLMEAEALVQPDRPHELRGAGRPQP